MQRPLFSRYAAALALILLLAAWLRLTGLSVGLPAVYNPDEVAIVSRTLAFAKGDLNPHNFLYPTFFFYVLFAWLGAYFAGLWLVGAAPSLAAFQAQFFVDPSGVYLAARTLGVMCGLAGVAATWWLARRLFGRSVAIAAALFLAVAPAAVRDAHYVKHDVPVTLAIVLAMIAIAAIWPVARALRVVAAVSPAKVLVPQPPTAWQAALAGAACGVAFSTHYYALFLAAPLALAVWHATRGLPPGTRVRHLAIGGAAMVAAFFACSPFLLAEPGTAWRDIVANRQIVVDRSGSATNTPFASASAYARMLWSESVGWPVLLLAAWGMFVLVRLSRGVALWLLAFPLVFFAFIANTVAASRYLNPVLPFLALLAALAAHDLAARLAPRRRVVVALLIALLAALPGAMLSRRIGVLFQQDDTRTLAKRTIEASLAPGSTVLLQPYSVPLQQSREGLLQALAAHVGDPARASTKFQLLLKHLRPWPEPSYRLLYLGEGGLDVDKIYFNYPEFDGDAGLARLRQLGVRQVVLKKYNVPDPATLPLVRTLERAARLVARITPYRGHESPSLTAAVAPFLHNTDTPVHPALERPGPIVEIWAVR